MKIRLKNNRQQKHVARYDLSVPHYVNQLKDEIDVRMKEKSKKERSKTVDSEWKEIKNIIMKRRKTTYHNIRHPVENHGLPQRN